MLQNIIYMAEQTFAYEHELFHLQQTNYLQSVKILFYSHTGQKPSSPTSIKLQEATQQRGVFQSQLYTTDSRG